ncbi:hypothetical protein Ccrd_013037 [Cynara cardunculus var. scolymus]|uniref:Uncharacterized protein n=1 Tax=Cynara cardunculus var. scolymus TaxID=59895 RepID=A0A103YGC4_CYNCS|nr:hypothetical protein Ccrd_013037 [Cynara cardunculus var. scolymus]
MLSSFSVLSLLDPAQMLTCPDFILIKQSVLLDLLKSFQPKKVPDTVGTKSLSSTGGIDCLYGGVYAFLEGVLDAALCFSFMLASEVVLAMESVVISLQKILDKPLEGTGKHTLTTIQELLATLRSKLSSSAQKLLSHNWHNDIENGWKGKVNFYVVPRSYESPLIEAMILSILLGKWFRRSSTFTWKIASPLLNHWRNLHALFCLQLSPFSADENLVEQQ